MVEISQVLNFQRSTVFSTSCGSSQDAKLVELRIANTHFFCKPLPLRITIINIATFAHSFSVGIVWSSFRLALRFLCWFRKKAKTWFIQNCSYLTIKSAQFHWITKMRFTVRSFNAESAQIGRFETKWKWKLDDIEANEVKKRWKLSTIKHRRLLRIFLVYCLMSRKLGNIKIHLDFRHRLASCNFLLI